MPSTASAAIVRARRRPPAHAQVAGGTGRLATSFAGQVGVLPPTVALARSWVLTASTHLRVGSAGMVWHLLPARIARQGVGNVTVCTNARTGLSLESGSRPGPTRSRGAGPRHGHRTNADESRPCRGPAGAGRDRSDAEASGGVAGPHRGHGGMVDSGQPRSPTVYGHRSLGAWPARPRRLLGGSIRFYTAEAAGSEPLSRPLDQGRSAG
jgi:hypothetical protein